MMKEAAQNMSSPLAQWVGTEQAKYLTPGDVNLTPTDPEEATALTSEASEEENFAGQA